MRATEYTRAGSLHQPGRSLLQCVGGGGRLLPNACTPPRAGESAKDKGKKGSGVGDKATGWLAALEAGGMLVVDAPWELQLAKEMANAAALLNRKRGEGDKDTEETRYRSVHSK